MLHALRGTRLSKGISQEELAERSGVHRDTIQKLETGQRPARPATITRLADALGVRTEELTKEGRHQMSEEQTINVPVFYPNFEDVNFWKRFDGSEEAWLWNQLRDFKDRAIVESLATVLVGLGDDVDLPGLAHVLWVYVDREDAEKFIKDHEDEIAYRAAQLARTQDKPDSRTRSSGP